MVVGTGGAHEKVELRARQNDGGWHGAANAP